MWAHLVTGKDAEAAGWLTRAQSRAFYGHPRCRVSHGGGPGVPQGRSKRAKMCPRGSQDVAKMAQGVPKSETRGVGGGKNAAIEFYKSIKKPAVFPFGLHRGVPGTLTLGAKSPHLSSSRGLRHVDGTRNVSIAQLGRLNTVQSWESSMEEAQVPHGGGPAR